jgi:hypothetical protein
MLLRLLPLTLLALISCRHSEFAAPGEGLYRGFFRTSSQLKAVDAEVAREKKSWRFTLRAAAPGAPEQVLWLRQERNGVLELSFPGQVPEPLRLSLQKDSPCFVASQGPIRTTELCLTPRSVELEHSLGAAAFSLSLVQPEGGTLPSLEEPRTLGLTDFMRVAREQSFTTRVQAERALQSRLRVKQAYLNLLPSLNLWTGVRLATNQEFLGLINLAGSLTPFLFPSRWIQASAQSHLAKADRLAGFALRSDVAFLAETMGLSYLRDRESAAKLREELALIRPLRDELVGREKLGLLEPGASDEISLATGQIELTVEALETSLHTTRTLLGEVAGFTNPDAIRDLEDQDTGAGPVLGPPADIDPERSREIALVRSYELRQMDELIRAARLEKLARFFMWLDPSGEQGANLGAALPITVAIQQSRIDELSILREQMQASILQKIEQSRQQLLGAERYEAILSRNAQLQRERLERLMARLKMGFQVPIPDLLRAIQGQIQNDLDWIRSRYQARGARALWLRTQLTGTYQPEGTLDGPTP